MADEEGNWWTVNETAEWLQKVEFSDLKEQNGSKYGTCLLLGRTVIGGGRKKGICKWFNVAKGWGFLTPVDGSQDVFVHQSVINKGGFRSLADGEEVEFEAIPSDKGMEATQVSGPGGLECRGSERRPMSRKKFRKIRCYNCGDFGSHIASKCPHGPLPKRCHNCKSSDHLIADCPLKDVLTSAAAMSLKGDDGTGNNNNNDATNGHGVLTSV